jgi:DNA uptake protein ComE-like DNA-binding protein
MPNLLQQIQNYFIFSKSETRGILVLIALVFVLMGAQFYVNNSTPKNALLIDTITQNAIVDIQNSEQINETNQWDKNTEDENIKPEKKEYKDYKTDNNKPLTPHNFNPNTVTQSDMESMNFRPYLITTILKMQQGGFKFYKPETVQKIYGLKPEEFAQLKPYINIPANESKTYQNTEAAQPEPKKYVKKETIIDIAQADSISLCELKGIGPGYASKILKYRAKLGGFINAQQFNEITGIPDSVKTKCATQIVCNPTVIQKINLNTATINTLKQHPYIPFALANAIIQYRFQRGGIFKNISEINNIAIVSPEIYRKLAPYLSIN